MSDTKEEEVFTGPVMCNDNYWEELEDAIEALIDNEHPNYENVKQLQVYKCKRVVVTPQFTAEELLEDLDNYHNVEMLPEDTFWSDNCTKEDQEKLDAFLKDWLQCMSREVWQPTNEECVIDWDSEIKRFLKEDSSTT